MAEEKVEETGTPQAVAEPEVKKDEEIDIDRIKNGDEEYTKQVNERLAKEAAAPPAEEVAAAPPAPAPEDDFVHFDDGDPIYKGQPFKVKKSELKAFVQKGRHLEVKLSELAPYVNVVKSNPELEAAILKAAHDPQGAEQLKRIGEVLKGGKITLQVEDDLAAWTFRDSTRTTYTRWRRFSGGSCQASGESLCWWREIRLKKRRYKFASLPSLILSKALPTDRLERN